MKTDTNIYSKKVDSSGLTEIILQIYITKHIKEALRDNFLLGSIVKQNSQIVFSIFLSQRRLLDTTN